MTWRLIVEPEAESEIQETTRWYDNQSPGLGADFLRAVEAALSAIQRSPLQYQIVYGEMRRVGIRRFPYSVFYVALDEEIIVLACLHGRRNPRRWQDRG
jgi:plasmid stabilization system protein ParE